jgi:hypothetical protein
LLSRFYRRVDVPYGQRYHATRALAEAQAASDVDQIEEASALLAELPPEEPQP